MVTLYNVLKRKIMLHAALLCTFQLFVRVSNTQVPYQTASMSSLILFLSEREHTTCH